MPETSLLNRLSTDFSQFKFESGDIFHWSPDRQTIVYADAQNEIQTLHELGHAILNHTNYSRDIQLVQMEQQAWVKAKELAIKYNVQIDQDQIDSSLDSYRDWLHARSTCPKCQSTGVQKAAREYRCLACSTTWRVNDARLCELRRYVNKSKKHPL